MVEKDDHDSVSVAVVFFATIAKFLVFLQQFGHLEITPVAGTLTTSCCMSGCHAARERS